MVISTQKKIKSETARNEASFGEYDPERFKVVHVKNHDSLLP